MPKVSVIVPVYNVQEYLGQCLDAILLQTLQDIEVICIDDGSTDDSGNILNTYAMFDERLKIIHQENKGAGPARNCGLQEASGEYVMFLDSDDLFIPDMLEKMLAKAKEDNSDIVICNYLFFDNTLETNVVQPKIETKYITASPLLPKDYSNDLFDIISPVVWNKLFKTQFIKKHHLKFCNLSYASDISFSCTAMALADKISIMQDCFVHYRQYRDGQLTDTNHGIEILTPLSELYNNLHELNLNEFYKETYLRFFFGLLRKELKQRLPLEQRDFLNQIIQNLPSELAKFIFGNSKNKISIIIPVSNMSAFLPKCLESCLNQTLKEIEIICVNDASTDNSLEILNKYAQEDNRIKIINRTTNKGPAISRNDAMKIATGEYIQFIDADDWIESDTCACLYLYAKIYVLDMLSFPAKSFSKSPRIRFDDSYLQLSWLPQLFQPVFTWHEVLNFLPLLAVTAPLTIYRHQYLIDNNIHWIHKKVVYEDTPFFVENLSKGARMGALKVQFYQKRAHKEAISSNMDKNYPDYCWICKYTLQKLYRQMGHSPLFRSYLYTFMNKLYLNYQLFNENVKKQMIGYLYKFCFYILKQYHMQLSAELIPICQLYIKDKSLKKKLEFILLNTLVNWQKSGYTFIPIKLSLNPLFISICGININLIRKKLKNKLFLTKK